MNPCPECGSTDRHKEDETYALLRVYDPVSPDAQGKLDLSGPKADGFICRLIVCGNCGYVALTTNPG